MIKIEKISAPLIYQISQFLFILFLIIYFTGGLLLIPESWISFFDSHPRIHRKILAFVAGAAVILGLLLLDWARRDKLIGAHSRLMQVVESWKSSSTVWVTGFFIFFGAWWTTSSCLRYESMNSGFDMAIFTQAIWNTTQGDWFYSSIKGGRNLLGDHFSPLLAAFALPYKIWPDPKLILILQAFAAAASVFPLARIVRQSGQSPAWSVIYCLSFALYLPVRNAVRFDFHPEIAAMPLFLWAFAFLQVKRTLLASLFLGLALMAKENIATVAFAFGLYACIKKEKLWGFGIFWMLFSICYFVLIVYWLIPKLSGAAYFYLDGNFTAWIKLGWDPFAKHMFQSSSITYLSKIYAPLAFTSFLAPATFILTLPTLAQNLLARNEMARSIFFQYTTTLTPFVFIASVIAMAKIRSFRRYWAYLLLLTSVLMSGVSEIYPMRRSWIQITPHTKRVAKILRSIPAAHSLRTHEFYATHAANRKELHIYENNHPKEGGSWKARHTFLVAIDQALLKENFDAALETLKKDGYQVQLNENGFCLLQRLGQMGNDGKSL